MPSLKAALACLVVAVVALAAGLPQHGPGGSAAGPALGLAQRFEPVSAIPEAEGRRLLEAGEGVGAGAAPPAAAEGRQRLQAALEAVEQLEEQLWGVMDGVAAALFGSSPAAGGAAVSGQPEPEHGRRLMQAAGATAAPATLDSVVAKMQSLAQHLLAAQVQDAIASSLNAAKAAIGLPVDNATATPAATGAATDAFSAVVLGSIADTLNASAAAPATRALLPTGAGGFMTSLLSGASAAQSTLAAASSSVSAALSSGTQLFSQALSAVSGLAKAANSTASSLASSAAQLPAALNASSSAVGAALTAGAVKPATSLFSSFLSGLTAATTPAASPAPASATAAPANPLLSSFLSAVGGSGGSGSSSSTAAATPASGLFSSFLSAAKNAFQPGSTASTTGAAPLLSAALATPALQSATASWQQQMESVLSTINQHSAGISSLAALLNGTAPQPAAARRRLLQLAAASDVPSRFRELKEQWIHGAKPLTATSRHLLQSLPIDTAGLDPEGAMQLVMVQGIDAVTAGQRMVDGLIGLLRDTIFLTMEAAQQAQQAQQPALFFPFLQEQVLVGASLEPPARAGEPAAMEPATAEPQRQPQPPANAIPTASEQEVLSTGEAREGEGEGGSYYYSWWGGAAPEPPSELVFDELMAAAAQEFGHVVGRRLQSALGTAGVVEGRALVQESSEYGGEYSYSDEYSEEHWLDSYGWMAGEALPEPAALGLAGGSASDPAALPPALLDWLSQVAAMLADTVESANAAAAPAAPAAAEVDAPGLPAFAIFGPKQGRVAGKNSTNATEAGSSSGSSGLVAAVVVPLSGAARAPPQQASGSGLRPASSDAKWWGIAASLGFVGLLLGAAAVVAARRSSTARLDSQDSYAHIPGVPPPSPARNAAAPAPKAWETAVQKKAAQQAEQRPTGTVAKKLSNLPA